MVQSARMVILLPTVTPVAHREMVAIREYGLQPHVRAEEPAGSQMVVVHMEELVIILGQAALPIARAAAADAEELAAGAVVEEAETYMVVAEAEAAIPVAAAERILLTVEGAVLLTEGLHNPIPVVFKQG